MYEACPERMAKLSFYISVKIEGKYLEFVLCLIFDVPPATEVPWNKIFFSAHPQVSSQGRCMVMYV
jgi:hypothetical protein